MRFYETHFEDYLKEVDNYDIHPEIQYGIKNIHDFNNIIIYGASGIGKYTQLLKIIKALSPSELKYDKKMVAKTDKHEYIYRMSDIHYEIDMGLLGCNSKMLWHEIYFQIVDIISVKTDKIGIIVCKNFHKIHSELLDIFYSYIQHLNTKITSIQIKFILLTEHISFLPTNILNVCKKIGIKRPKKDYYLQLLKNKSEDISILDKINKKNIINIKEIYSFSNIKKIESLPNDIFNTVCDEVIKEIENYNNLDHIRMRDILYDILVYNLDMTDCLWYILSYFIESGKLNSKKCSDILEKSYSFLKYYNNNYRPIYHLESIIYYIINKLYIEEDG